MIGKSVLDTHGESVGIIKDVVIDRQSKGVSSVVKLLPMLGSADVAVPVSHFALAEGQFSLPDDSTTRLMTLTPFHFDNNSISIANPTTTSWSDFTEVWNLLRPQYGEIAIRVDLQPRGASLFVRDQNQGTTHIQGLLRAADMPGLRLELKGYRPCRFGDGTYSEPASTDPEYATFRCKLTAVH